jgi:SAM-dependent methyltransferase
MTDEPGYYAYLDFNAPLSDERAARLVQVATRGAPRTVLDVGCGWGELLLRLLAAAPEATGVGVDQNGALLERGRANARSRGLDDRVQFVDADGAGFAGRAEVVICIGADHAFGDQGAALAMLRTRLEPGGRLVFGTGFWQQPPTAAQAEALGAAPGDLLELAGLVDLAVGAGFRPLDIGTATPAEWEAFESGFLADHEEWLLRHPDHPAATDRRADSDRHRTEWLRGYAGVLGFAYLVLGRAG